LIKRNYIFSSALKLLSGLLWLTVLNGYPECVAASEDADRFVGSAQCSQCHKEVYVEWQGSDHQRAMLPATGANVLGDFNDVTVTFHGIETRFYRQGEAFRVATVGLDGKPADFEVPYTFGHYPLQQYLVDIGNGRLQALNVAWDSRDEAEGGQRWYHLQADEDIDPGHPFFWARHFQNANSRCIECHSTDFKPASRHLGLATSNNLTDEDTGFPRQARPRLSWAFEEEAAIATPSGARDGSYLDACGACHSTAVTSTPAVPATRVVPPAATSRRWRRITIATAWR
jgi:cytochrome c553